VLAVTLAGMLPALVSIPSGAMAEDRQIEQLRRAQRTEFTDAEIIEGFFKTSFGSELRRDNSADRIRKYEVPVRIFIDNRAHPDRQRQLVGIIADIGAKIEHIDIAITDHRDAANVTVTMLADREFAPTLRAQYGKEQAAKIQKSLEPQCLAGLAKDTSYRILHSEVFLVVDAGNFIFKDCGYEEMLQALGPINDDNSVPWTMFNDNVSLGFFGVYDQLLLNILYNPRIKPGMNRDEVARVLPEILPEVRAFVARANPKN
jgi:hypothetical protein